MAIAEISPGNCGFHVTVEAEMDGGACRLKIASDCAAIQKMALELTQVDPFQEISFLRSMPAILEAGVKHCTHAACPVPVGAIKAVEIAACLALPTDVSIQLWKQGLKKSANTMFIQVEFHPF